MSAIKEERFNVEPRLRSYARLITQNFRLKVLFQVRHEAQDAMP